MKAQGMSIGVVITAALAVMVLLMVGGFMSGGFQAMTGKITSFVGAGPSAEDTSKIAACDSACVTWKSAGCKDDGLYDKVQKACGTLATGETNDGKYPYGKNADGADVAITSVGSCSCNTGAGGAWGS